MSADIWKKSKKKKRAQSMSSRACPVHGYENVLLHHTTSPYQFSRMPVLNRPYSDAAVPFVFAARQAIMQHDARLRRFALKNDPSRDKRPIRTRAAPRT